MHDERTGVAFEQDVLSAPPQLLDALSHHQPREVARHALPQIGVAHGDARDGFPEHERLDAAAGNLDFRQLWHRGNSASLSRLLNIPKLPPQDSVLMFAPRFALPSFAGAPRLLAFAAFVLFSGCALNQSQPGLSGDEAQEE